MLLAGNSTRPDYVLRTYVLASQEKEHTKVAYVLDITDPDGRRLSRFASEEIAGPAADPWAAVSPELAKTVAAKAVGGFEEWLTKQGRTLFQQSRDDAKEHRNILRSGQPVLAVRHGRHAGPAA